MLVRKGITHYVVFSRKAAFSMSDAHCTEEADSGGGAWSVEYNENYNDKGCLRTVDYRLQKITRKSAGKEPLIDEFIGYKNRESAVIVLVN